MLSGGASLITEVKFSAWAQQHFWKPLSENTVCLCNHKIKLKLGDSEKNRITSKVSFVFVLFFTFFLATLPLALLHYKCNKSKKKKKSANNRSQEETRIFLAKGASLVKKTTEKKKCCNFFWVQAHVRWTEAKWKSLVVSDESIFKENFWKL